MKKLALALAATAALIGQATAADMAIKASPPPPPAYNWTGCYLGGGFGFGKSSEDTELIAVRAFGGVPAGATFVDGLTQGGSGWLATAQAGCDYQFAGPWGRGLVIGGFVDGDLSDISGRHTGGDVNIGLQQGNEKLQSSWALGARAGLLITPQLLTYVSGGFTEASFGSVDYVSALFPSFGRPVGLQLPGRTLQGWFIGGGTEYALGWLPGLFWKTEYRWAEYDGSTVTVNCTAASLCGVAGPTSFGEHNRPSVQTLRTELVWRFNWAGR